MPQSALSGETGYNAMGVTMAATVICQITPEYFRKQDGKPSETLLSARYLVPQVQLLDYLIANCVEYDFEEALAEATDDTVMAHAISRY